ncbi:FixH family protein [Jannaschia helgolandensis]|uniref:FixH family protein n=1 Tax=Jannaschia helgolandensis TaxID=188906 RepID=UPI0030DD132F
MRALARRVRPLNGWYVAGMFVGGFAIIIGVNLVLAISTIRTFPGLETDNIYIASQQFDAEYAAQEALGWTVLLDHDDARLRLAITDTDGESVRPGIVAATLGRATTVAQDCTPDFDWNDTVFLASALLEPAP